MDRLEPIAVEVVRLELELLVVAFVDGDDEGFPRPAQDVDEFLLGGVFLLADRRQKDDKIGLLDGQAGLVGDVFEKGVLETGVKPARIDAEEGSPTPVGAIDPAVARHARPVVNQRAPLPHDSVEERRFADVGAADDRHHRQPLLALLGKAILGFAAREFFIEIFSFGRSHGSAEVSPGEKRS